MGHRELLHCMNDQGLRLPRRTVLKTALATAAAAPVTLAASHLPVSAQEGEDTTVGRGGPGANGFEFVGVINQLGFDFVFAGFLTRVAGIDPSLMFLGLDPTNRSADAARLTIHGVARATSRSIFEPLFVVNGEGQLSIFHNDDGGATFDDLDSFQQGTMVAQGPASLQNVITVIAPQTGIANGNGTLLFTEVSPFTLGGQAFEFRLFEPAWRISFVGHGNLIDPDTLESTVAIAGNAAFIS
jgi:hypothetical protein